MGKRKLSLRILSVFALTLLVAAVLCGCGSLLDRDAVGEDEYTFTFTAVFADGSEKSEQIVTKHESVGGALYSTGIIDGEESATGLYVKSVYGVVADYDIDGSWWALYIDGESAMCGVDAVKCADVGEIEFRVEK